MLAAPPAPLFVTTAHQKDEALTARAEALAAELTVPLLPRRDFSLPELFAQAPTALRALVVQRERLLLAARTGEELFYHPNMAFLRLGNALRGQRDALLDAAHLTPGERVLDCTLGYAAEAILCAHAVGVTGEVHGVEAAKDLGLVVREGLQSVTTDKEALNEAMRRVRVVHLGHHLDYLKTCETGRYDLVCFDPFFEEVLPQSSVQMNPLRFFGDGSKLLPEAVREARRVARRRVLVKAERGSPLLDELGIRERIGSRHGKVVYGVL